MFLRSILIIIALIHIVIYFKAVDKVKKQKKFYDNVHPLLVHVFGIFVWGDALVLAPFFIITSIALFIINNIYLTIAVYATYMFLRQFGEVIYWLLQQFSQKKEYRPPDKGWEYLKTDELHIIYQLLNFYKSVLWFVVMIISFIFFNKAF